MNQQSQISINILNIQFNNRCLQTHLNLKKRITLYVEFYSIIDNLRSELEDKQLDVQQKQCELNDAFEKIRNLKNELKQIPDLEMQNEFKSHQIEELEKSQDKLEKQRDKLKLELHHENENHQRQLLDQEQEINDQQKEIKQLKSIIAQQSQNNNKLLPTPLLLDNSDQIDKLQKELREEKRKIQHLESQMKLQGKATIVEYDEQISKLKQELEKKENARQEFIQENQQLRQQIQLLKKENTDTTDSLYILKNQLREQEREFKSEKRKNEEHIQNIRFRDEQLQQMDDLVQKFQQGMGNQGGQQLDFSKEFNQLQQQIQKQKDLEKANEEKIKKQLEEENRRREEKLRDKVKFDDLEKSRKRNQAKLIQEKMSQSHGQMDVCFLVDVTHSMDPYKDQTRQCITNSMTEIKRLTNRDTNWASVCYQDFNEYRKQNQYQQFQFSKNPQELEKWLHKVICSGGGDLAEDIKGGIKQMCQKLNWKSMFKIAILICDAPCHGEKYHDKKISDDHLKEDITEAILELIQSEILLIGLNFKAATAQMYQEIFKIYQQQNKMELFMLVDMQETPLGEIAKQMVLQIGQASQNATMTNNNSTKSKKQAENQQQTKDGAMEALCKQGKFQDFEKQKNVETVDVKFTVYRTEIKAEPFERNIQTIQNLEIPDDYLCREEGQWDSIRTKKPFAYGMMKAVFLMKKKSNLQNELYVIKTPLSGRTYGTMKDALIECKSHLICQKLMSRFNQDLQNAQKQKNSVKKYPQVIYSDFLILKENDASFWIAERFFQGEFVKYNNNFGFISNSPNDLNKIAQAFSYYSYFTSNFNYMVNDVQGVNTYFTDPAINTKLGDFDDTDMGENGQAMYMANFSEEKRKNCQEILQLLELIDVDQANNLLNRPASNVAYRKK